MCAGDGGIRSRSRPQKGLLRPRPRLTQSRPRQGTGAAMTVIDLSGQLDDIRRRYPEYWNSDEAQRELKALWGSADCNDCGFCERGEPIRILLGGQKPGNEDLRIAAAPIGWHPVPKSHWYGQGGGGSS